MSAPLRRNVTVVGPIQYDRRGRRIIGAVTPQNAAKIERGVAILRTQTGLDPAAFAQALDEIVHAGAGAGAGSTASHHPSADAPALSMTETVSAAQIRSAEYVHACGLPCNFVFGAAYAPAKSYVGCLQQAERLGLFTQARNYAGVAAGTIVAALLAAGVTIARLAEEMKSADYARVVKPGRFASTRLVRRGGFLSGKRFVKWFRGVLRRSIVDDNITLRQLHDLRGGRLVIACVRMSDTTLVYIDYRSHPDMRVWEAVRAACAVYPLMAPYKYNGEHYADASTIAGLPMSAFYYDNADQPINQRTLGFLAICDGVSSKPRNSHAAKMAAAADCAISAATRTAIDEQDRARTIVVDCGRMSNYDFAAPADALIDAGAAAVVDHFAYGTRPIADKYAAVRSGFSVDDEPAATNVVSVLEKGKTRTRL